MNTSILNSQPQSPPGRWSGSSRRLFRPVAQASLIMLVLFGLASAAQAWFIIGVSRDFCNCTNLNIQLAEFPDQDLLVQLGGVAIPGTYNFAAQQIIATLPAGQAPGAYLLSIFNTNNDLLASTNFNLSCCGSGPEGPPGVKGDTGATGLQGPAGPAGGPRGAAGPRGLKGEEGDKGAKGDRGAIGATGRQGPTGPRGPKGDRGGGEGPTGATGPAGPPGTNGPAGPTGATGPTGPPGQGGGGSSQYGYVYNVSAETVAIEAPVPFSDNGILTSGITHAPGDPGVAFTSAGDYKVTFSVSGTEPSQFALFLNGAMVTGTIYGSGAGTQQNTGQAIFRINAGDVLTLVNHSSAAAVGLPSLAGGTQGNVNASILVQKLN